MMKEKPIRPRLVVEMERELIFEIKRIAAKRGLTVKELMHKVVGDIIKRERLYEQSV